MSDSQGDHDPASPPDGSLSEQMPNRSAGPEQPDQLIEILASSSRDEYNTRWRAPLARRPAAVPERIVFTVQYAPGNQVSYRVDGAQVLQGECGGRWAIDFGALNLQLHDLGLFLADSHRDQDSVRRDAWRRTARELGTHMYDGLLAVDESLAKTLIRLRRARPTHRLTLVFAGPDTHLSVPFELLHDADDGISLALSHPLCRQITGEPLREGQSWRAFFTGLQQNGEPLRVLLISSGAEQVGATDEVSTLEALFESLGAAGDIRVAVDLMLAGDATLEQVRARLRACPYHIVHYVGQVFHDAQYPEQNGLLFAARQDAQLGQVIIGAAEFSALLAGGDTRLVYLSAGIERSAPEVYALRVHDDFDLLRAVVRAWVPYGVGLRWYVPPDGRRHLAVQFYTHLLAAPFVPEVAMLQARRAIARADARDESWIAPILIAQNVDVGGG